MRHYILYYILYEYSICHWCTAQSTVLPYLLPDVTESWPQTDVQLGEDLLIQQCHQSGLSH